MIPQQIRTQTPQNRKNKARTKFQRKYLQWTRKSQELQEGNQHNHESFHTLGGQILYKAVKKIYAYGAKK
jgi:hypothetical protein